MLRFEPVTDIAKIALAFAREKHEGQVLDRDGKPHIEHCMRVASFFKADPEMFAAAILHDVLEDTDANYAEMINVFGERITQIVLLLTRKKEHTYFKYLQQIIGRSDLNFSEDIHQCASIIKVKDIEDNLNRCDAKMTEKVERYRNALNFLNNYLQLTLI